MKIDKSIDLEDLKSKGLVHLAELLESEKKDEEDEPELDDESDEKDDEEESDDEKAEVKESSFEQFASGLSLQESEIEQMRLIFETAVQSKADSLAEQKMVELEARVQLQMQEQEKTQSAYLDFVVESWIKKNELEIENQLKVNLAENLLGKLAQILNEHSMILSSDEEISAIQEAEKKLAGKEAELQEAVVALADASSALFATNLKLEAEKMASSLSQEKKTKFMESISEIEIDSNELIESVVEKFKTVFADVSKTEEISGNDVVIEEEIQIQEQSDSKKELDGKMGEYLRAAVKGFSALKR